MRLTLLITLLLPPPLLASDPPYPPSPLISRIDFAPLDSITRLAPGSDNFPLTWADDDALYTTFGDGHGFHPLTDKKLSLGFARIDGSPPNITAANIRSPHEQLGQGRAGRKGWGLLCVDGTLYLSMGHANLKGAQSQLAWSKDHARTWTFADWKFEHLGLLGFINFGRNYAGAPDNYVYAYSHDHPSADTPADHFILLRVPKDKITDKNAWEYFTRLDKNNEPLWSKNFTNRGPVFTHKGHCLRSAITYNAPLKRYLWWQHLPAPKDSPDRGDTRFTGGFAIYDAPNPWGPWTTAFYTSKWDTGPGEHADFPSKWISPDGKSLHLVFSGNDSFSIRKATIVLKR